MTTSMEQHPDIVELRARYERAGESPVTQATAGLTMLTGLWLAISPWVLGFNAGFASLTMSNLVTGLALAVLALGFGAAYSRAHGLVWVAALLGVWAIIVPWIAAGTVDSAGTIVSNVITGGVAVLLGLAAMGITTMKAKQRG